MRKKVFAMMLAAMMIGTTFMGAMTVMADPGPADPPSTPTPANSTTAPYSKVKPNVTAAGLEAGITEEVEVDKAGATTPNLEYTLTISGEMKVYEANGVVYGDASRVTNKDGITGTLGTVNFDAGEVIGPSEKDKEYTIASAMVTAINDLEFDRPGIYFWEITKTVNNAAYPNDTRRTALVIRVDEDGSKLHAPVVSVHSLDSTTGMPTGDKHIKYEDVFDNSPGQLTVKNTVSGNQGSKDQYMKYTVTLTGLDDFKGHDITPTGANTVKGATPKYGEDINGSTDNLKSQTIGEDGTVTFEVWLKDGEMIEFPDIPTTTGVKYSIEEKSSTHTGYDVSNKADNVEGKSDKIENKELKPEGSRVEFFNEKQTATPTGVIMAVAPAFAVILIGGIGVGIILAGRGRREEDEEA